MRYLQVRELKYSIVPEITDTKVVEALKSFTFQFHDRSKLKQLYDAMKDCNECYLIEESNRKCSVWVIHDPKLQKLEGIRGMYTLSFSAALKQH